MKVIRSVQNKQVKEWKKLSTKKGRKKQNAYLLDGWHLVKEALAARSEIKLLLVTEDFKYRAEFEEMNTQNSEEIIISEEVAKHLSETPSPQGIFGVIALKKEQSTPVSLQGGAC